MTEGDFYSLCVILAAIIGLVSGGIIELCRFLGYAHTIIVLPCALAVYIGTVVISYKCYTGGR